MGDYLSWSVYTLTNKVNNKKFVGVSVGDRDIAEIQGYPHKFRLAKLPELRKDIDEYGWDNFELQVVATGLNKVDACRRACVIIKDDLCFDRWGYNDMPFPVIPFSKGKANHKSGHNRKRVRQTDMSGNVIAEYDSASEAARAMNSYPQYIQTVCRGTNPTRRTAYGFRWEYITEDK